MIGKVAFNTLPQASEELWPLWFCPWRGREEAVTSAGRPFSLQSLEPPVLRPNPPSLPPKRLACAAVETIQPRFANTFTGRF